MNARYSGTCKNCHRPFPAGALITYTKADGSRHVTCTAATAPLPAAKPAAPKVDAGCAAAPYVVWGRMDPCRRAALDMRLAGDVGQTRRFTAQRAIPEIRKGADAPAAEPGVYTVVGHGEWRYQNAEDNEDMGDCGGPNWSGAVYLRRATAEETAKHEAEERREADARAAEAAKVASDKAAKEAAAAAYVALLTEKTAGLVCAGESFEATFASRTEIAAVKDGRWFRALSQVTMPSGAVGYVEAADGDDDFRRKLWAPEADVHATWATLAAKIGATPASAAEWLTKYAGCSDTEFYQWVAAQTPAPVSTEA